MTQTSKIIFALFVTIPAACMTGPSAETFPLVTHAKGVQLIVSGKKAAVRGELLEVRENELLVLEDLKKKKGSGSNACLVTLVPFRQVRHTAFKGTRPRWDRGMPTADEREELRLLSRFPTGVTPPIMAELLSCSGRPEPETVTL